MERDIERENFLNEMLELENWEMRVFETVCPNLAEKKRKFQRDIEDLFEPFIQSGRQQDNFEWGCVKSIYNGIKNEANRIWSLRISCAFIFNLFCIFKCEDHPLIVRIIYMYHQVLNEYEYGISFLALCNNCMHRNYPRHYYFEELKGTSFILSKVNNVTGKKYKFTNCELYSKLTIGALNDGDYAFLKFLVQYGLSYFPDDEVEEVTVHLRRLKHAYQRLKLLEDFDFEFSENFIESVTQTLLADDDDSNIIRLILIVRYVNICLRRRLSDNYYPDYVKCLNLYVQTLPEAAVSVKDVEDFLYSIFFDDRDFITDVCSDFQEIFPGNPSFSSPRSLQHLCRCTVRDCIEKSSPLPSMLSGLHIPRKIKDYLLILSD